MNPTLEGAAGAESAEGAMVKRSLGQAQLDQLLEQLIEQGLRLVAPVRRGDRLFFDRVSSASQIVSVSDYVNTDMPPKAIADLADAPPTPSVNVDPTNKWLLIMERPSLASIDEHYKLFCILYKV